MYADSIQEGYSIMKQTLVVNDYASFYTECQSLPRTTKERERKKDFDSKEGITGPGSGMWYKCV